MNTNDEPLQHVTLPKAPRVLVEMWLRMINKIFVVLANAFTKPTAPGVLHSEETTPVTYITYSCIFELFEGISWKSDFCTELKQDSEKVITGNASENSHPYFNNGKTPLKNTKDWIF